MIERQFVAQRTKEYYVRKYIEEKLNNVGISQIKLKKIPLGEKIIIYTSRPSLVVGSKGANIRDLSKALKKEFQLENPQIEINEIKDVYLDAQIVADRIASSLERFGAARFKGVAHKIMTNVMNSGALGIEVIISGKIPSARAKSWRFYQGYLKKSGDVAIEGIRHAKTSALLKSGMVGIRVAITPPDLVLPDELEVLSAPLEEVEKIKDKEIAEKEAPKKTTKKRKTKSRAAKVPEVSEDLPSAETEEATKKLEAEQAAEKKEMGNNLPE